MPVALAAVVMVPLLDADFSSSSLKPIIVAAGMIVVTAAAVALGSRSPAD